MRFTIYSHSPLATLCSLAGGGLALTGIILLVSGEFIAGAICAALGIALYLLAMHIADKKEDKLKKINLIRSSADQALTVYNADPSKQTLKLIKKHNPAVAQAIISAAKASK